MSAHIRMLTKILNNKLRKLQPPQLWQYAQHTGYKRASSAHVRCLVCTMVLQCIRRYGGCAVVLLDIAEAYDDVIRQALIKMAKPLGAEVLQVVEEFVKAYDVMRVHVVTAYGLSHWYRQVEGVVKGGGDWIRCFTYCIYRECTVSYAEKVWECQFRGQRVHTKFRRWGSWMTRCSCRAPCKGYSN